MARTPPGATPAEVPFFAYPDQLARQERTRAQIDRDSRPSWRMYTGTKRQPCGACVERLHAAGGVGPRPTQAGHVRTIRATGETRYLCEVDAEPIKRADDAAAARAKGPRR